MKQYGTQEELDAAKHNANKLPYGKIFLFRGDEYQRGGSVFLNCHDNSYSVIFTRTDDKDFHFVNSGDLSIVPPNQRE